MTQRDESAGGQGALPIGEVRPRRPLLVACPFCGALAGSMCKTPAGDYANPHKARVMAARYKPVPRAGS
jgi:hypothetical protein